MCPPDPHEGMTFIHFEYLIRFVDFDPHGGMSFVCFEYLIRFVASDLHGGVSPIHEVTVVLCGNCSNQGFCDRTNVKMDEEVATFGRASCVCDLGYDGLFHYSIIWYTFTKNIKLLIAFKNLDKILISELLLLISIFTNLVEDR